MQKVHNQVKPLLLNKATHLRCCDQYSFLQKDIPEEYLLYIYPIFEETQN